MTFPIQITNICRRVILLPLCVRSNYAIYLIIWVYLDPDFRDRLPPFVGSNPSFLLFGGIINQILRTLFDVAVHVFLYCCI